MPTSPTRIELARQRRIARERFRVARIAERAYAHQLAAVGRHIGAIVKGYATNGIVTDFEQMKLSLADYSRALNPWAKAVSARMQADVSRRDLKSWHQLSRSIGSALSKEIALAPTGDLHRRLLAEQVTLITTIPLDAAERVHQLTLASLISGARAEETQKEIMRSGQVSAFNAYRIARTETSRTAALLTEARGSFIGSPGYWWRTVGDADVRSEHRILEGKFIEWNNPPVAGSKGERAHAGCIYFCRCFMEPQLPDSY